MSGAVPSPAPQSASRMPLLRLAWRESRTARRRLLLYMSSIFLGVAALVAIDSFASNTQQSVREQARALLGGDISVTSRQDFPKPVLAGFDSLRREGVGVAMVSTFASMALVERTGSTRLAQIRAVSNGYPWYGEITTAPQHQWARLQSGRFALVDPSHGWAAARNFVEALADRALVAGAT